MTRLRATVAIVALLAYSLTIPGEALAVPLTDNLVAWWEFSAGNQAADSSGNGRSLTFRANPNAAAGAEPSIVTGGVGGGHALRLPGATNDTRVPVFNGSVAGGDVIRNDEAAGAEPLDLGALFAVQAWVSYDSFPTDQYQTIIGKTSDGASSARPGWHLTTLTRANGERLLQFIATTGIGPVNLTKDVALATDTWHHIVVTSAPAGPILELRLFLDGIVIQTGISGALSGPDLPLLIGDEFRSFAGTPDIRVSPVRGELDKVAIWNRSLTDPEVAQLYNGGRGVEIGAAGMPEPSSLLLFALGAGAFALRRRRTAGSGKPSLLGAR